MGDTSGGKSAQPGLTLLNGNPPGFVDPFSINFLNQNAGLAMDAMTNRYAQLGLGTPGGSPQDAAAGGTNLSSLGAGTPEQMDLGDMPSLGGGIRAQTQATAGQMENNALSNPLPQTIVNPGSSSSGSKGLGGLGGGLGSLLGGL